MILATRHGGGIELRAGSTLTDFGIPGPTTLAAGVTVSPQTSGGIPAVTQAVRVAAEAVGQLDLNIYRGEGPDRRQVRNVWQSRLFAGPLNDQQDVFAFKATIEESLTYRGNAFLWKTIDPSSRRVVQLWALHPDQVLPYLGPQGQRLYQVAVGMGFVDPVGKGFGFYTVDSGTILLIRGFGDGGAWLAPSPVQRHRLALGTSLARLKYEANMFERGTSVRLAVSFPAGMQVEQARAWRDLWKETMGATTGDTTAVIGGGATLQPISLTQTDAQFIESQVFSVDEIGRIFNVPSSLIGGGQGQRQNSSVPTTPEHEQIRWATYGLGPRLMRIESGLRADPDLFPVGSSVYPMFKSDGVVRGDLATEETIAHQRIQDGRMLVDEWRAEQGLPPLPNGLGKIPQITPAGAAPNENPAPVANIDPNPAT